MLFYSNHYLLKIWCFTSESATLEAVVAELLMSYNNICLYNIVLSCNDHQKTPMTSDHL